MANDTIVDIYCHIMPEKFFRGDEPHCAAAWAISRRGCAGVKKLFDLDERFREMDQFGDYREIVSLPNPPIEDLAAGEVGLELGADRQRCHGRTVRAPSRSAFRPSSPRCR